MSNDRQPATGDELARSAAAALDDGDVLLLERIAAGYDDGDPVPPGLVDRILFGLTLDALQAEVAELQRSEALAGVRAQEVEAQTVTFTSSTLTTMVTITVLSPEAVRLDGWVAPGAGVEVELHVVERSGERVLHTVADGDGRFVFDSVGRGLARFVLRRPPEGTHQPIVTPSIEL